MFSVLDTEATGVISLSQILVGLPRLKEKKANSKPPPILIWYFSLNPSGETLSKVKETAERAVGSCECEVSGKVDLWKLRRQAA